MEKVRLSEPLFFMHLCGMHPIKKSHFTTARCIVGIIMYVITVGILLMELLFNFQGIQTLSRASESLFAQYALGWKIALFVLPVYKKEMAEIVTICDKFWPLDEFSKEWTPKFASQHKFLRRFFRVYAVNLAILCTQFVLIPFISSSEDQQTVMMYYKEKDASKTYATLVFIVHAVYMFYGYAIVVGFDCLFFYLIGHIVSELKMLEVTFSGRDMGKNWDYRERFRISVEHHIYILDYVSKMNNLYTTMLLHQHVCCLFGICFGIFLMTKDGIPPDFDHFSKYVTYISSYILQIWTYCFAGDQIIHWSSKIPNEIFYDNWEDDNSYRNGFGKIIAIHRAQRPAKITLGGFGDLDIDSFNVVMKNAVNFFMFMDTMYND